MVKITAVAPGSIAEELELQSGDTLIAINGHPVRDLLDYVVFTRNREDLSLEVIDRAGTTIELDLEKDAEEDLGLDVEHPDPAQCGNRCLFCFVHQLPRQMRPTLYVKDEDYRFSYLYGAYVTLSNIREEEIARILEQHLSPLYVSVHATDEALRAHLLGRQNLPPILGLLQRLIAGGIEIHTQVVVCPGINDGAALEQTISDLAALAPGLCSLAIVPVGLTEHRQHLARLRAVTAPEAQAILALVAQQQQVLLQRIGSRWVYAADELYLRAGTEFPPLEAYEGLPQYENGVGMIPYFRHEADAVLEEAVPLPPLAVDCVTGVAFAPELTAFTRRLAEKIGVTITVHAVENRFFGAQVTVAGLLTGQDLIAALQGRLTGRVLLLPEVLFRDGEDILLDDVTPDALAEALDIEIFPIPATPWGILQALEAIAADQDESL